MQYGVAEPQKFVVAPLMKVRARRDGIRVISLNPGPVETERLVNLMKKKARDRSGNADNWRELFKPLPFGRACAPQEVGAMIAFLASELVATTAVRL